mmetsp:Transcript_5684/g.21442  ORF Transcript_5684/g.21442 Transcript_5684/m.21442 type:complete len:141 (+) Transcript_5684:909-1331(+)
MNPPNISVPLANIPHAMAWEATRSPSAQAKEPAQISINVSALQQVLDSGANHGSALESIAPIPHMFAMEEELVSLTTRVRATLAIREPRVSCPCVIHSGVMMQVFAHPMVRASMREHANAILQVATWVQIARIQHAMELI